MIDKAQIAHVLDRLAAVEAAMGDPAVLGDAARYRATVREHTALRKLEVAAKLMGCCLWGRTESDTTEAT